MNGEEYNVMQMTVADEAGYLYFIRRRCGSILRPEADSSCVVTGDGFFWNRHLHFHHIRVDFNACGFVFFSGYLNIRVMA